MAHVAQKNRRRGIGHRSDKRYLPHEILPCRPPPLCDIPSGSCSFTGPWTVTRSSLRMLRRVAAFCRLLRPVLLLVSFPRSRSPVVGVLGLCWMWRHVSFARQRHNGPVCQGVSLPICALSSNPSATIGMTGAALRPPAGVMPHPCTCGEGRPRGVLNCGRGAGVT